MSGNKTFNNQGVAMQCLLVGSDMKCLLSPHPIHKRHSEWVTLLSQDKEKVDYSSYISVFNTGF